eukprot:14288009-Alexandrium_andersonii.AAC.1
MIRALDDSPGAAVPRTPPTGAASGASEVPIGAQMGRQPPWQRGVPEGGSPTRRRPTVLQT